MAIVTVNAPKEGSGMQCQRGALGVVRGSSTDCQSLLLHRCAVSSFYIDAIFPVLLLKFRVRDLFFLFYDHSTYLGAIW